MTERSGSGKEWLREIARRAMKQRGFEPEFPPPVLAETQALTQPAARPWLNRWITPVGWRFALTLVRNSINSAGRAASSAAAARGNTARAS